MTIEEKIEKIEKLLGEDEIDSLLEDYLSIAERKILNKLYPYDKTKTEVPERYENLEIELVIYLYNQRGVEGQDKHTENSITRSWRSETEILAEITPFVGTF